MHWYQAPSQSQMHRASLARAYLETKYKNLNQESQDREENQQKIQMLNARMDQMGIAESERDKYRQPLWQEVRCFARVQSSINIIYEVRSESTLLVFLLYRVSYIYTKLRTRYFGVHNSVVCVCVCVLVYECVLS